MNHFIERSLRRGAPCGLPPRRGGALRRVGVARRAARRLGRKDDPDSRGDPAVGGAAPGPLEIVVPPRAVHAQGAVLPRAGSVAPPRRVAAGAGGIAADARNALAPAVDLRPQATLAGWWRGAGRGRDDEEYQSHG